MPPASFVSSVAGLFWGITESVNKNITEEKFSVYSYSFIQQFGSLVIYILPFILFGSLPKEPAFYIFLALVVLLTISANLFLIKAYKTEDISSINIISRISLIIAFLSGVFLLHESVTIHKILGIILVISGIITIFYERKKLKITSGFLSALFAGILFGSLSYFTKLALKFSDSLTLVFLFLLFSSPLLLLFPQTKQDIKPIFAKYKRKIIFSRLTGGVNFYLIYWSIEKGNISTVITNYETVFLLSTLTIGVMFLKEKKNIAKKLAGSFLCVLGIILLNFF